MNPIKGIMIVNKDDRALINRTCFIEHKLDDLFRPRIMILDDIYKKQNEKQRESLNKWFKTQLKGKYKMRDNNCKANHDRGLQKRIDNYNTMKTVNTMEDSPAKVQLTIKQKFYNNVLKMLKLA